jgi:hypothetical protein
LLTSPLNRFGEITQAAPAFVQGTAEGMVTVSDNYQATES